MRILMVSSDTFPPTRVDVTELFGIKLAGRGHRIDYILQSETPCAAAYETPWSGGQAWVGATDLGESLFRRVRKHVLGIVNDFTLVSRVRRGNYDFILVKDKFLAGAIAAIACKLLKARFVFWLSYPFPEHYLQRAKDGTARYPLLYWVRGLVSKWLLYGWLLRAANHVFVQSEQMRCDLEKAGVPLRRITAVPMGISPEMFDSVAAMSSRRVLPAQIPCVLYLGTLNQVRRMDFLIRVFARVKAALPSARLYLVGRGDEPEDEAVLHREAARLQLESSIIFVGQLARSEALQYVVEADVCVSPFYPTPVLRSASPTKLVEYMALGKAVVANDHPEQRRVIEESGAGLCVPYEEEPFADAIMALLKDPRTAARMGERGRQYVLEHRSYDVIADGVESRMLDIIEE